MLKKLKYMIILKDDLKQSYQEGDKGANFPRASRSREPYKERDSVLKLELTKHRLVCLNMVKHFEQLQENDCKKHSVYLS